MAASVSGINDDDAGAASGDEEEASLRECSWMAAAHRLLRSSMISPGGKPQMQARLSVYVGVTSVNRWSGVDVERHCLNTGRNPVQRRQSRRL